MAWRTAGRLGRGGGPLMLFFPTRFGDAAVLQEGVSNHRHECMTVKPVPGPPLEVIETELLF